MKKTQPTTMIHIEETTLIDAPISRCFDLSRSVEVHLRANVHSGEQTLAVVLPPDW